MSRRVERESFQVPPRDQNGEVMITAESELRDLEAQRAALDAQIEEKKAEISLWGKYDDNKSYLEYEAARQEAYANHVSGESAEDYYDRVGNVVNTSEYEEPDYESMNLMQLKSAAIRASVLGEFITEGENKGKPVHRELTDAVHIDEAVRHYLKLDSKKDPTESNSEKFERYAKEVDQFWTDVDTAVKKQLAEREQSSSNSSNESDTPESETQEAVTSEASAETVVSEPNAQEGAADESAAEEDTPEQPSDESSPEASEAGESREVADDSPEVSSEASSEDEPEATSQRLLKTPEVGDAIEINGEKLFVVRIHESPYADSPRVLDVRSADGSIRPIYENEAYAAEDEDAQEGEPSAIPETPEVPEAPEAPEVSAAPEADESSEPPEAPEVLEEPPEPPEAPEPADDEDIAAPPVAPPVLSAPPAPPAPPTLPHTSEPWSRETPLSVPTGSPEVARGSQPEADRSVVERMKAFSRGARNRLRAVAGIKWFGEKFKKTQQGEPEPTLDHHVSEDMSEDEKRETRKRNRIKRLAGAGAAVALAFGIGGGMLWRERDHAEGNEAAESGVEVAEANTDNLNSLFENTPFSPPETPLAREGFKPLEDNTSIQTTEAPADGRMWPTDSTNQ